MGEKVRKSLDLFLTFMKIGAFTFGGGYAMIAMIQYEAEQHGWLTQTELVDFVGLFALTTVLAFKKVHPILIILLSAVVGIAAGYALGL